MCSPIIFFTSCSSGGDSTPLNESLLAGNWMQISLEADYRYYGANNVTLFDTTISWSAAEIASNLGYYIGYEINEDGTYAAYSSDGVDTFLDGTGTWSATSRTISIDGTVYGTYTVTVDNLTVNTNDVIGTEIEPGMYMDATNITEVFANIDGFSVISEPQAKKKKFNMKKLFR